MVGKVLAGVALAGILGCSAKASMRAEAKEPEPFSEAGQMAPPVASSTPATAASATSGKDSVPLTLTGAATTLRPGCSLVCNLADAKGRMAPDVERKFTAALADDVETARGCSSHASFTLRFDSSGTLTEYGVDGDENACIETLRGHHPPVSYPGPAIARCAERCKRGTY